jgi:hypothetical protein
VKQSLEAFEAERDERQRVVDLVRHPGGERAECGQTISAGQRGFQPEPFGDVAPEGQRGGRAVPLDPERGRLDRDGLTVATEDVVDPDREEAILLYRPEPRVTCGQLDRTQDLREWQVDEVGGPGRAEHHRAGAVDVDDPPFARHEDAIRRQLDQGTQPRLRGRIDHGLRTTHRTR